MKTAARKVKTIYSNVNNQFNAVYVYDDGSYASIGGPVSSELIGQMVNGGVVWGWTRE